LQKNREFIKKLRKKNENKHKNQEEQFRCKQNVKNICVLKYQYKNNFEGNRFKRRREQDDLENKRATKRIRYEKDFENQGALQQRVRYTIVSKNKQYRQKLSECKYCNNKQYYKKEREKRKKKNKSKFLINKCNVANKIIKKYQNFRCQNSTIKFHNSLRIILKNIFKKLNIKNQIEKQLEAEKIIRWCMHIRNNYIRNMYNVLAVLKKKSEICLTLVSKCCGIDEELDALCGISRHTASSENYFVDSTYRNTILKESLVMNMEGQLLNVLPLITAQAKKSWSCSALCKTDNPVLIERYQKFLETVSTCTVKNISTLIKIICTCTVSTSNMKLGHAQSCYVNFTICESMFLPILLLSPHFPKVRNIRRLIYQLINFYQKMLNLDEALYCADLETLNKIVIAAQEKADIYKRQQTNAIASDDDIFSKYKNAFKALKKRLMDTPRYACVSCEKLCYKKNISEIIRVKIDTSV